MQPVGCVGVSECLFRELTRDLGEGVIHLVTKHEAEGPSHWALWTETPVTISTSSVQCKNREDSGQFESGCWGRGSGRMDLGTSRERWRKAGRQLWGRAVLPGRGAGEQVVWVIASV